MADSKKYYYMRLKEDYFDSNEIAALESMENGFLYSNILLKLYLRSLKDDGRLMFNNCIPYDAKIIASITRHEISIVEQALNVLQKLGLIEILDSGAIYMLNIQQYIGQSSSEADRVKAYRKRLDKEKNSKSSNGKNLHKKNEKDSVQMYTKPCTNVHQDSVQMYGCTNVHQRIENRDKEYIKTYAHQDARVSENDSKNNAQKDNDLKNEFEKLWESYPNKKSKSKAMKSYIKARKRIKNPVTYEQVEKGIEAYTQYIQEKGLDMQYVKHGSTWFNNECWNDDYTIDPNKQNSLIKNNGWF